LNGIDSLSKDRAADRLFLWPAPAADLVMTNALRPLEFHSSPTLTRSPLQLSV
jgi:hypothetical protein